MNLRLLQYTPSIIIPPLKNTIEEDYIIYNGAKYIYELIENDDFDRYDMNCNMCCFSNNKDSKGYHSCPSIDKDFNWKCTKFIDGFQILLKESK